MTAPCTSRTEDINLSLRHASKDKFTFFGATGAACFDFVIQTAHSSLFDYVFKRASLPGGFGELTLWMFSIPPPGGDSTYFSRGLFPNRVAGFLSVRQQKREVIGWVVLVLAGVIS